MRIHDEVRKYLVEKYGYDSPEFAHARADAEYSLSSVEWRILHDTTPFEDRFWKEASLELRREILIECQKKMETKIRNAEHTLYSLTREKDELDKLLWE